MLQIAVIFIGGFTDVLINSLIRGVLPIVMLVLIFLLVLNIASKRRGVARQKVENMLDENIAADSARNKDIGEEFFYTPILENLPINEYSEEEKAAPSADFLWQSKVVEIAKKKMLRFDRQYSNIELKHMFGASNLESVARYEENFSNYNHALRHWAEALLGLEKIKEAERALEESVASGSEISQSYTLLANIYFKTENINALKELKAKAQASSMPGKKIAVTYIDNLLAEERGQK